MNVTIRNKPAQYRTSDQPKQTSRATAYDRRVADDQITLSESREKNAPARTLPNLSVWDSLLDKGQELLEKTGSLGEKIWDTVSEATGLKKEPSRPDPQPAEQVDETPTEVAKKPETPSLRGLPDRAEDAKGGREFMESIKDLKPGPERDKAVLDELLKGNIPDSARHLKEVTVKRKDKDGREREIKMHVMPDYLSIGSDNDNVRIPMTPAVAQAIADKTGTSLPTDRMVDDIHSQSRKLHLDPFAWKPGAQHARNMQSIEYYLKHDERIDAQLGTDRAQTELVSGHKKDLVIPAKNGRVAIYGGAWPGTGNRVQPYSNKHFDLYEDYSHGVRLVSREIEIDGQKMQLEDVLADPNLAPLVTRFPATGQAGALANRYPVPERLQRQD